MKKTIKKLGGIFWEYMAPIGLLVILMVWYYGKEWPDWVGWLAWFAIMLSYFAEAKIRRLGERVELLRSQVVNVGKLVENTRPIAIGEDGIRAILNHEALQELGEEGKAKPTTRRKPVDPIADQIRAVSEITGGLVEHDPQDPRQLIVDQPGGYQKRIPVHHSPEMAKKFAQAYLEKFPRPRP